MAIDIRRFLEGLNCRPGATDAAIAESVAQTGGDLPGEYVNFLRIANGAEGFIGKASYVMLWSVEELAPLNRSYEVERYAPGLLIFGSDGGGEAYGFDTRTPSRPIVQVPFVGMDWGAALPLGESFNAFLKFLSEVE